jgi:hypothetical protein
MDEDSPAAPATERLLHEDPVIHRRRRFLLGIMCLSLVMVVMAVSGLNVALPSMQGELDASASQLQWIVDVYALVFAALLLPAGALADRFGRKGSLLLGLAIFATGSAIGGIATGVTQITVGRVINGVGAAFVMPSTLSLLTTIFPPHERRRAIAVWAGVRRGRRRARDHRVRSAARGVLVGVGPAGQRARRGPRGRRRLAVLTHVPRSCGHAPRPGGGRAVADRPRCPHLRDHRGPDEGLDRH